MSKCTTLSAVFGAGLLIAPVAPGFAQAWVPGAEIAGHAVQVETNGVVNTVHFEANGVARIQTPGGNVVPATWSVANNRLCLNTGGAQECWPYTQAFQAGQMLNLTSSCQVASRWTPLSTAQPPAEGLAGERG